MKNKLLYIYFCLGLSLMTWVDIAKAQVKTDTSKVKKTADTVKIKRDSDIKTTITYYAKDSIVSDVLKEEIYLYGDAKVTYGDITLTAAQIYIDQRNQEVTARGLPDSTGRYRGRPVFKQGSDEYVSDSMKYNFKSEKAIIRGIETKQGDGFLQTGIGKKNVDGSMYAAHSRYTTCNLKHPHWYINSGKIKMIPEKQVVSGPFNLVIADIPTPLGFFLGIFPLMNLNKPKSGLKVPTYGEDNQQGFYLRDGGFIWAINEYMDASILGSIYTNGSWGINTSFNYTKRYRFNGNANIRFNNRISEVQGEKTSAKDFWIQWSHSPTPRGKSSFSANVNFGTTSFNQRNSFNPTAQLSNNYSSAVSYSTSFNVGTSTVTLSMNARQDQNSRTGVMNVTFPELNLGVNRIYPFKRLTSKKVPQFLKQLNLSYRAAGLARFSNAPRNRNFPFTVVNLSAELPDDSTVISDPLRNVGVVSANEVAPIAFSLANFNEISKTAQMGITHTIPLSTTLKIFRYFSVNPSLSYQETWYPRKLDYTWINSAKGVKVDTTSGFSRVYSYSASASMTTRIYGTFLFNKKAKNKDRYLQAIRHTMVPTIGWSYAPDLSGDRYGFYRRLQTDTLGNIQPISRFQGFEPGASISTNQSGVITFGLQNFFEAKIKPKGDTASTKKLTLLDNVSFTGNYNLVKDSLQLSPIAIGARTKFLNLIDFNFSGTLDPYVYRILKADDKGNVTQQTQVNKYAWQEGKGLGQLTNFNVAMSINLTPKTFNKATKAKADNALNQNAKNPRGQNKLNPQDEAQLKQVIANPELYVDFDIPWTLNMSYNLSYSKLGFLKSSLTQVVNFNGDVSLTKSWKVGFRSGYDFTLQKMSYTNFDVYRDLHCWEMRFTINPFGAYQSWSFDLNVKSSILQDLKISRRRSFYDRGFTY